MIRVEIYKTERTVRPALDGSQDLIVFLTQLLWGWIFEQRVSEREHHAFDAHAIHETDQLGHALFGCSSRC